ncbi:hypothetical protein [Vulcanococcus limneticus]|uniref:hypothetical protein n=1 Tax=Vulcanococcus limneticus TaxID=2170428 RepID=UPI00398BD0AA
MNIRLPRTAALLGPGILLFSALAPFHQAASAETLVRAAGRCKLERGGIQLFNGHCSFKHKAAGGTDAFVVKLDDGTDFNFSGPNPQALQLQTYSGILNVRHNVKPDHDLFLWNTDGGDHRLSVRLDSVQNPDATFEDRPQKVTNATLAGVALGGLIGALIAGSSKGGSSEPARVGAPVSSLQSLVGVRGASAESEITSKGYTYRGGDQIGDSAFSYWQQPRTKNCVAVRTTDGRYQSITYTEPSKCR